MVDQTKTTTTKDKPCCQEKDGQNQEKKLVKATELPIHGNPFPAKDCVEIEAPSFLESKVRSARTMLQPYVSPMATAYEKTSDVVSIGVAHSQSAIQRLAENENSVVKALIISTSGLVGFGLARRGGIFRRLLFSSMCFSGAMVACYPQQSGEKAQLLWYVARNKLPEVARQQYEKFAKPPKEE